MVGLSGFPTSQEPDYSLGSFTGGVTGCAIQTAQNSVSRRACGAKVFCIIP